MNVTSIASNVYSQYHGTLDGLKNGTVSYLDAMQTHEELFPQARGLFASVGGVGTTLQRAEVPAEILERIQNVLANTPTLDSGSVAKAYRNAGGEQLDGTDATQKQKQKLAAIALDAEKVRKPFNAEAYDYLSGYASAHKSEWMATAESLGLSIEGGMYLLHFYQQPKEAGYDVSMGMPNSKAEQIFRHIASSDEISEFEARMAPAQEQMERRMTDNVAKLMGNIDHHMTEFAPYVDDMEAAGVTIDDMARTLITRGDNGEYKAARATDKSAAIEAFINNNSEVRAFYDQTWEKNAAKPRRSAT